MYFRLELNAILVAFAASLFVVLYHPICALKANRTAELRDVLIKLKLGVEIGDSTISHQLPGAILHSFNWMSYGQCLRIRYRNRIVPETNCTKRLAKE